MLTGRFLPMSIRFLPGCLLRYVFSHSSAFAETLRLHGIIVIQMIIFDNLYKLGRISRISGITGLLKAIGPRLIISYFIIKQ